MCSSTQAAIEAVVKHSSSMKRKGGEQRGSAGTSSISGAPAACLVWTDRWSSSLLAGNPISFSARSIKFFLLSFFGLVFSLWFLLCCFYLSIFSMLKLKIRAQTNEAEGITVSLRKMFFSPCAPPPVRSIIQCSAAHFAVQVQRKKRTNCALTQSELICGRIQKTPRFKIQDSPTFKILKSEDIVC